MAIARDANTASDNGPGFSSTSLTFSHTCASSAFLVVGLTGNTTANGDTITGVTYNTVAMTLVDSILSSTGRYIYLYFLGNPASGAHNVVISSSSNSAIVAVASSYTGAVTTSVKDSSNHGSGGGATTKTVSTTTVSDNCWLVGWASEDSGNTMTAGSNTSIVNQTFPNAGAGNAFIDSNGAQTPAGSKSLTVNWSGSASDGMIVASFAPVITAFTLSASVGSFSLTGISILLTTAINMVTAVGTFVLTGIGVSLSTKIGWVNLMKNISSFTNSSKSSNVNFSNLAKNISSWINNTKK